jgi:hypothetical protein
MDIIEYIKSSSNSEILEFIKDLKDSEKNKDDIFKFSKNFRHLLSISREYKYINLQDFITILDYHIKNEIMERISKNKMIIY